MFLFYFSYVGFMFVNKKVKKFADKNLKWLKKGDGEDFEENEEPKEGNPWTDFEIGPPGYPRGASSQRLLVRLYVVTMTSKISLIDISES